MNAAPREFRLVGSTAIAAVRQALQTRLSAWAAEWLAQDDASAQAILQLAVTPVAGAAHLEARTCLSWGDARVWLDESPDNEDALARAIAGACWREGVGDPWLSILLARGREALDEAICAALAGSATLRRARGVKVEVPVEELWSGSGSLHIVCPCLGVDAIASLAAWHPHIASSAVAGGAPLPPLHPLGAVAGDGLVRLVASLGSVQLDAFTALDLQRGDVLSLDRRLDEGVDLTCEGVTVCRADLGQIGGRLGVQVRAMNQEG